MEQVECFFHSLAISTLCAQLLTTVLREVIIFVVDIWRYDTPNNCNLNISNKTNHPQTNRMLSRVGKTDADIR